MTGVHGLQHVERLAPTYLADDDAVGTHPERVTHEISDAHLATALDLSMIRRRHSHGVCSSADRGVGR